MHVVTPEAYCSSGTEEMMEGMEGDGGAALRSLAQPIARAFVSCLLA